MCVVRMAMHLQLGRVNHVIEDSSPSRDSRGSSRPTLSMDDMALVHLGRLVLVTKWIKDTLSITLNPESLLTSLRVLSLSDSIALREIGGERVRERDRGR